MFRLIGFCGLKTAGKTEAAKAACKAIGAVRISFADPLYAALAAATGCEVSWLRNPRNKDKKIPGTNCLVRHALQTLGTEWGRDLVDPNLWVNQARPKILAAKLLDAPAVFEDLRFPNELSLIREFGGEAIWIEREGLLPAADTHASETSISSADADRLFKNMGTLAEFRASVSMYLLEKKQ